MASETSLPKLIAECKSKCPESLKPDFWYVVAGAALVTASEPSNLGKLYEYVVSEEENSTRDRRRTVSHRLHMLCMKQWVSIGAPRAADAFLGLVAAEEPGDADMSLTKKHTQITAETSQRGTEFLNLVYGEETVAKMFQAWGADMQWLTRDVVYGLFFADDGVFDFLQTEVITYISILCQGLSRPRTAHLQGLKRMGMSEEDAQSVDDIAYAVCKWAGKGGVNWSPVNELVLWDH